MERVNDDHLLLILVVAKQGSIVAEAARSGTLAGPMHQWRDRTPARGDAGPENPFALEEEVPRRTAPGRLAFRDADEISRWDVNSLTCSRNGAAAEATAAMLVVER